jgi:hypothetical protein
MLIKRQHSWVKICKPILFEGTSFVSINLCLNFWGISRKKYMPFR